MKTYKITYSKDLDNRHVFRCEVAKGFSIGKAVSEKCCKNNDDLINKLDDIQHFIANSIDKIECYELNYDEFVKMMSGFKDNYEKTINDIKHRKKKKLLHRDYEIEFINEKEYELQKSL